MKLFSRTLYMTEFHLRVSVKHDTASHIIKAFVGKFKPIKWICCYENKNLLKCKYDNYDKCNHDKCKLDNHIDEPEEKNPHIHTYLKYGSKPPTKQQISKFFKSQPILKVDNVAGYYHREQKKTSEENIIYTTKGGHYINYYGFTEEELESYNKKNEIINSDKKLSSKEKLFNRYKEYLYNNSNSEYPSSKFDLFRFIDETYVIEWGKTPLAIGHKISYALYILIRIHKEAKYKDEDNYQIILKDLYNIKWDFGEYRDKLIEMKNRAFLDIEEDVLEAKIKIGKLKKEHSAIIDYL